MEASVQQVRELAQQLNASLDLCARDPAPWTLIQFMHERVTLEYNPVMTSPKEEGGLGFDEEAVRSWCCEAFAELVCRDLRTKRFVTGELGSSWFDTEITTQDNKTRRVRVCMRPEMEDGKFGLVLDATFDTEW